MLNRAIVLQVASKLCAAAGLQAVALQSRCKSRPTIMWRHTRLTLTSSFGMLLSFMVIAGLAGCLTSTAGAQETASPGDWSGWRGPLRDGVCTETGLLDTWNDTEPPLRWKVTGLGQGFSTVSLANGVIYTMGERDGKTWLIALDEHNGKKGWAASVGSGKPNSTPTVDLDRVFALGHAGDLVCVDAQNGEEVWRRNIAEEFGGNVVSDVGYSESVLVDGNRVLCTPGGGDAIVVALERTTGDVLWKASLHEAREELSAKGADGAGCSSIVLSEACGIRQYVQLVGRGLISVRADDGKLLWVYNRVANNLANISTPIVRGDYVFCSTAYSTGSALLRIVPDGKGLRANEEYFLGFREMQNHHGGLVLVDDHIYSGHGHNNGFPLCIEMKTGKVAWRPGRGPGTGSAAVLYADGHMYFRYENGVMALIQATPEQYILKGSFRIASDLGKSWPHPVVAGGMLYLRDEDALLCYDLRLPRVAARP
jgi:outer membrane protein assembly factor BamB